MAFELPVKGDKIERGEIISQAIELAYDNDSLWTRAFNKAIDRYLKGERNFQVQDPLDPTRTLVKTKLEDGFPAHEAIVSDVNTEIGKQQQIDIAPVVRNELQTLESQRDRAVAQGLLAYHFPSRVINSPNRVFQRMRVEHGCAGMAITESMYPGFGWGLRLIPIPYNQLVFLPSGRSTTRNKTIVWRQWLPYNLVNEEIQRQSMLEGVKLRSLPTEGSDDWARLQTQEIQYGLTPDTEDNSFVGQLGFQGGITPVLRRRGKGAKKVKSRTSRWVLFSQVFCSENGIEMDRKIMLAGRVLMFDKIYEPYDRFQMPIATSTYADVGGPYGRSYAQARMSINMRNESVLTTLLRNFQNTDVYGVLALSKQMGLNMEDVFQETEHGFKLLEYNVDPNATNTQPVQIKPHSADAALGRTFGVMSHTAQDVFPNSPLDSGQAVGRVDSKVGIDQTHKLGQTRLKAGAESSKETYLQMYRCGLEMAQNHYTDGQKIPIFLLSPDLAGVVLDVEEIPRSQAEEKAINLKKQITIAQAGGVEGEGFQALQGLASDVSLNAGISEETPDLVPVARFTIGPNTIPHPNKISLDIRSMLPRDEDAEFEEIITAQKLGAATIMECQIEMMERGLTRFYGGKMVRASYRSAVLNLLSAFGDGKEHGPILLQPHVFSRLVGFWVISAFVADALFGMASKPVKNQVMNLLFQYAPINQTGGQPSADEAAAMYMMQQQQRNTQANAPGAQLPQLPQ